MTNLLNMYAERDVMGDVHVYRDEKKEKHVCTFLRGMSSTPTRRNKYIMINCWRWRLNWL